MSRPPPHFHGKEGVSGSSPEEGSAKALRKAILIAKQHRDGWLCAVMETRWKRGGRVAGAPGLQLVRTLKPNRVRAIVESLREVYRRLVETSRPFELSHREPLEGHPRMFSPADRATSQLPSAREPVSTLFSW
jgi:hypothetical protein